MSMKSAEEWAAMLVQEIGEARGAQAVYGRLYEHKSKLREKMG